jgi:hypothetical protein
LGRTRVLLSWAPYTWIALPIVGLLAVSRYGWPQGVAEWLPYAALGLALAAVERGCLMLFSLAVGGRSESPRDLGYQLILALGFAVVLWSFREYMNQPLS